MDQVRYQEEETEEEKKTTEVEEERGQRVGGAGVSETLGTLTMLYVLPQDPVFGIILKSHKAALLGTADLGHREEGAT